MKGLCLPSCLTSFHILCFCVEYFNQDLPLELQLCITIWTASRMSRDILDVDLLVHCFVVTILKFMQVAK